METETRFSMLGRIDPGEAERLMAQAQQEVEARYHHLKGLAGISYAEEKGGEKTVSEDRETGVSGAGVGDVCVAR